MKVSIAGQAVVITSGMKLEDLKSIAKYRSGSLVLKGGEDGKEDIFAVGTGCKGSANEYGVTFNAADDKGFATVTLEIPCGVANRKEWVVENLGEAINLLGKLEDKLGGTMDEIHEEQAKIESSVTVIA